MCVCVYVYIECVRKCVFAECVCMRLRPVCVGLCGCVYACGAVCVVSVCACMPGCRLSDSLCHFLLQSSRGGRSARPRRPKLPSRPPANPQEPRGHLKQGPLGRRPGPGLLPGVGGEPRAEGGPWRLQRLHRLPSQVPRPAEPPKLCPLPKRHQRQPPGDCLTCCSYYGPELPKRHTSSRSIYKVVCVCGLCFYAKFCSVCGLFVYFLYFSCFLFVSEDGLGRLLSPRLRGRLPLRHSSLPASRNRTAVPRRLNHRVGQQTLREWFLY